MYPCISRGSKIAGGQIFKSSCAGNLLINRGSISAFSPQTLNSSSFGALSITRLHNISFESPDSEAIDFCLVKGVAALKPY